MSDTYATYEELIQAAQNAHMAGDLAAAKHLTSLAQSAGVPEYKSPALPYDREGAPLGVRSMVGGAPVQDRQANLQQYYPDATPYGEDNFLYTDPQTGEKVLYNPSGLDFGDVASTVLSRDGLIAAGGTAGSIAGGTAGSVAPLVGTTAGAIGGGAVGSGIGAGLHDIIFDLSGGVDTRTTGQQFVDVGTEAALDAAGGALFAGVARGARSALANGKNIVRGVIGNDGAARAIKEMTDLGVTPNPGIVSSGRATKGMFSMLSNVPGSAHSIQDAAELTLDESKIVRDVLADRLASGGQTLTDEALPDTVQRTLAAQQAAKRAGRLDLPVHGTTPRVAPATPQQAGETLTGSLSKIKKQMARTENLMWRDVDDVLAGKRITTPHLLRLAQEFKLQADEGDKQAREGLKAIFDQVKELRPDFTIRWDVLRRNRKDLGAQLSGVKEFGRPSVDQNTANRIYGAMAEDLKYGARQYGGEELFGRASASAKELSDDILPVLDKLADIDTPEKLFTRLLGAGKQGATILKKVRRFMPSDDWDEFAGAVLKRLGEATPGQQDAAGDAFSASTFMKNWNGLISAETKDELFGTTGLRQSLDKLARVLERSKALDNIRNTSGTARHLFYMGVLTTVGGVAAGGVAGATGLLPGDALTGAGQGAVLGAGSFLSARQLGKLMTNPKFAKWLADFSTPEAFSAMGVSSQLGRLAAATRNEHDIQDEVAAFIGLVEQNKHIVEPTEDAGQSAEFDLPVYRPTSDGGAATSPVYRPQTVDPDAFDLRN